jgi:phage terminase large subunit-like protein
VQWHRNVSHDPDAPPRWQRAGLSTLGFKSYDQGRTRWQVETLDVVWFDEEPSGEIYTEGLMRTNATDGLVWMRFTPLKGMSEVVFMFKDCPGFQGAMASYVRYRTYRINGIIWLSRF